MTVGPVTAYGVTLDASAPPEQVAYVLLRSLRDDVEAAQSHDRQAQRRAFATTFSLAAFPEINKRLAVAFSPPGAEQGEGSAQSKFWREQVYEVINHWAPIVAYYVASFDTDPDRAVAKMKVTVGGPNASEATVLYPACHDPAVADPEQRDEVIVQIDLVKTQATHSGEQYWRVVWVGFRGPAPSRIGPATQPATTTTRP